MEQREQEEEEWRLPEQELPARRQEDDWKRVRELRAGQLQAEQQAGVERQSAKVAGQQLSQRASKGSRSHSELEEVAPSHMPHEEMFQQEVRGRTSEAS